MIYLQLFLTFFKIGIFGFGGGYAMLSMIQYEVVEKHQWISSAEFADIVAISQMTPGPISINSATYIGYTATGGSVWGSVLATLALSLPSFIIMLSICIFLEKFKQNKYVAGILRSLRIAVVGLLAAAVIMLLNNDNFIDYKSYLIFAVAFVAVWRFKLSPILMIVIAGVAGAMLY